MLLACVMLESTRAMGGLRASRMRSGASCTIVRARPLALATSTDLTGDGGVIKRTLVAGDAAGPSPTADAIVSVRFTAWLSDGAEIGSSGYGAPLELRLGVEPSEAIRGWEIALQTMRPGEKALVTCAAAYAYGAQGAPPRIPPDATLAFELDLVGWRAPLRGGGATAAGISRRWIDKLVALQEEGISMPTASANEMLHEMVREENAAARAGDDLSAASDDADADAGLSTADMRALRVRGEALKRKAQGGQAARPPDLEVVGGGLVGEPIVQQLYKKSAGSADRHTWVEGRNDLEVYVPLPDGVGVRDVSVSIERRRLSLRAGALVLEGALVRELDLEASSWLIQPASADAPRSLYLLLVKRDPKSERWGSVFAEATAPRAPAFGSDVAVADASDPLGLSGGLAITDDEIDIVYDVPRLDSDSR
jgi:hypothetical protein